MPTDRIEVLWTVTDESSPTGGTSITEVFYPGIVKVLPNNDLYIIYDDETQDK